jgi:hypothetical protein
MSESAKDGPSINRFTLAELIEKIREHEARKAERKKAEMLARGSAQIISLAERRKARQ